VETDKDEAGASKKHSGSPGLADSIHGWGPRSRQRGRVLALLSVTLRPNRDRFPGRQQAQAEDSHMFEICGCSFSKHHELEELLIAAVRDDCSPPALLTGVEKDKAIGPPSRMM
jgi:hypothetical protein